MGTPLNVISGRASLMRAKVGQEPPEEHARKIEEHVERLAAEVRRVIDYLTPPKLAADAVTVSQVLEDAVALTGASASKPVLVGSVGEARVEELPTLLVLTSLVSLGLGRPAGERGVRMSAGPAPSRADAVLFTVVMADVEPPRGRIDRFEVPQDADGGAETLQVLSTCFAVAQRHGGSVRVVPDPDGSGACVVEFECARVS
jgi:signal transduction histidine kinase